MAPAEVGGKLQSADVRLVIGTRPEAIKLAPVANALTAIGLRPSLIFTGQHALDAAALDLNRLPSVDLGCAGRKDPHAHSGAVERAMEVCLADRPDLLIVQGDTSSAAGAARAGFTCGVAVAHVEAGLRTFDPALPWPEEIYRTEIDARAALLFAPTETAAANLAAEGVPGAIHITGNTSIDAVLKAAASLPAPRLRDSAAKRLLVTCHRRESWDGGLQSISSALTQLLGEPDITIDVVLHPNAFVAERMGSLLGGIAGLRLLPPCPHLDLLARMQQADIVLSDSGGIQEEATALGVPLLVLREKTERPEGIASGSARLVGTSSDRIVAETLALLGDAKAQARMRGPSFPYGDGRASLRIAEIVDAWLLANAVRRAAPLPSRLCA